MYIGKHDCQVTARCPHCEQKNIAEIDYEVEKDVLGKTIAETIPDIICSRCSEKAFKRSRFEIASIESGVAPKEVKDG